MSILGGVLVAAIAAAVIAAGIRWRRCAGTTNGPEASGVAADGDPGLGYAPGYDDSASGDGDGGGNGGADGGADGGGGGD